MLSREDIRVVDTVVMKIWEEELARQQAREQAMASATELAPRV